jgi:hypothetical protein
LAQGALGGHRVDVQLHGVALGALRNLGQRDFVGFVVGEMPTAIVILVEAIDEAAQVDAGFQGTLTLPSPKGRGFRDGRPGEDELDFATHCGRTGQLLAPGGSGKSLDQVGGRRRGGFRIHKDKLRCQVFAPIGDRLRIVEVDAGEDLVDERAKGLGVDASGGGEWGRGRPGSLDHVIKIVLYQAARESGERELAARRGV